MRILDARLCDYAFRTEGKMSIIGLFHQVNLPKIPMRVSAFYVAVEIETEANESLTIGARFSDPDGKALANVGVQSPQAPGGANRGWLQFGFINQNFTKTGTYSIELLIGEEVVHTIPLPVSVKT